MALEMIMQQAMIRSLALLACAAAPAGAAEDAGDPMVIEHPEKIGIGTTRRSTEAAMLAEVENVGANWFYTWEPTIASVSVKFTPMVWGSKDMAKLGAISGGALLAFNEPDHADQAKLTPAQALAFWPRLMALGRRLGSPASAESAVGPGRWLPMFMAEAKARWYRVDFVAVHHYSTSTDIPSFKQYLAQIHAAYGKPIWVTEWALADFTNHSRFTPEQQQAYFIAAARMMDDLPYVERHAWFGMYEGLGNLRLGSGLLRDDGVLSPVGVAFRALAKATPPRSDEVDRQARR